MDFPDPDTELDLPHPRDDSPPPPRRPRRQGGGGRGDGGDRQQLLVRRAIALGAGLLVLFLLVLGARGCLDARKDRSLEDYSSTVTQIVDETNALGESFFGLLDDPGDLSVTEFTGEVESDRGAMDGFLSRVEKLSVPGDMESSQQNLELVYQLRAAAMGMIAERLSTALGDEGSDQAVRDIASQMRTLAAADVLYNEVTRTGIDATIASNGANAPEMPRSTFVPDPVKWGNPETITSVLGVIGGGTQPAADGGLHGTGLGTVSIGGVPLDATVSNVIPTGTEPVVDVEVQNQGEADESDITVSAAVNGGSGLDQSIPSLAIGETGIASILLTPAPTGEVTIDVSVAAVPGEGVLENNEASFTVTFE